MASQASGDYKGSIKTLNTETMRLAILNVKRNVKEFQDCRNEIERITSELLSTWVGYSRNSYETQYKLLSRNLKDIEEDLYDFYNSLVESAASYIEADEKFAKSISNKS